MLSALRRNGLYREKIFRECLCIVYLFYSVIWGIFLLFIFTASWKILIF